MVSAQCCRQLTLTDAYTLLVHHKRTSFKTVPSDICRRFPPVEVGMFDTGRQGVSAALLNVLWSVLTPCVEWQVIKLLNSALLIANLIIFFCFVFHVKHRKDMIVMRQQGACS